MRMLFKLLLLTVSVMFFSNLKAVEVPLSVEEMQKIVLWAQAFEDATIATKFEHVIVAAMAALTRGHGVDRECDHDWVALGWDSPFGPETP